LIFREEKSMSFVTTLPEALAAAAAKLETLGTEMASQNVAAATPTTGVSPAGADQVSALQATQFSAYGTLYQQISAQAEAIHEMFVNTLGTSASSYAATEAANQAAASSPMPGLSGLLGSGLSSNAYNIGSTGFGNWGAASSELLGLMAASDLLFAVESDVDAEAGGLAGLDAAVLAGEVGPAGAGGFGGAPVLASLGQASALGRLSVPPSWAGQAIPAASTTPATLAGAGWTTAAPRSAPVTTMPAGMPSVASAGREGFSFGAPRYGVKPTVMPKPAVV
jgi:hypothetical protein